MNTKKYILIISVVLFAAAAISAFGADRNTRKAEKNISKMEKNIANKNPKVRVQSAEGLAKADSKGSIEKLISQYQKEKDETVRVHLVDSIAQIGGAEAVEVLIKAVKEDSSINVRSMACLKLGIIKDASAKEALLEVFDNKEEDLNLRISASSALLSYMSDAKVYKTLENTIKSENQLLKFGLVNSLRGYKRTKEGKKLLEISNKDKDDGISKMSADILSAD